MDRTDREPVGVALEHSGALTRCQRACVHDDAHGRLLHVEDTGGIDARAGVQELCEPVGRVALAHRAGVGERPITAHRVAEPAPHVRLDEPRMRELVEHRLDEHARLGLEFELASDHAVGLDPHPPELLFVLPHGAAGDSGGVDAIARLTSGSPSRVCVTGAAQRNQRVEFGTKTVFVGIAGGFTDARTDRLGHRDRELAGHHCVTERREPR